MGRRGRAKKDQQTRIRSSASWPAAHRYGNGATAQFIALADRISGRNLDALFQAWLYTPSKPDLAR